MNEVRKEVVVRCSIEHAFSVFTSRIDSWWPVGHRKIDFSRLSIEPKVGGRFFELSEEGQEADLGEVLVWEPPHRIVYSWYPGAINKPTSVEVSFEALEDTTIVRILHTEGAAGMGAVWPERAKLFHRAWDRVLPCYIKVVEELSE